MNEDGLRAFLSLVRHRHFGRAAREQYVAVSTLSRRVTALERDVGLTLVDRATRAVGVTRSGDQFLPVARHLLAELDGARRAATRIAADAAPPQRHTGAARRG